MLKRVQHDKKKCVIPTLFRNLEFENVLKSIAFVLSFTLLIPLFLFLLSVEAKSDEFKLISSLSVKEEYNDNLFQTEKDKKADFITIISPGLELSESTERLNLNISTRVSGLIYAKNEDFNDVDYNGRAKLLYALDPRLQLSALGEIEKYSYPGQVFEPTGLVTSVTTSYQYKFGSGLEYALTEKTKTGFSYSFERYNSEFGSNSQLAGTTTEGHTAGIGFIHDLSQYFLNTAGRINLGYSWYQFQATRVNYYYGTIGMNRAFNEKWSILLDVGPSYTQSEFEVAGWTVGGKETGNEISLFAEGKLSYKGEKTSADLVLNHGLKPGIGVVGATNNISLTLNLTHRFTNELSGLLWAGVYYNRAERGKGSTSGTNQVSFIIKPAIRYEFTKDIALEGSYGYTYSKDKIFNTARQKNLFMINLIIHYPFVK